MAYWVLGACKSVPLLVLRIWELDCVTKGMMVTTVGEEKLHNPRLTKKVEEFVKIMEGLGLAYPKKIDESMPANMQCGLFQLPERMKDWV